ncbi:MAG TPA: DUF3618 domain-containing protein [Acidimicrobiales bacterium]|nr:DUF3618 domain-containing protein [Acidimicrobiales bacterium]
MRHDIEQTRARMTGTVDAIGDRVSPGRVVGRRMDKVRRVSTRVRHQVMGPPRQAVGAASSGVSGATSTVSGAASAVSEAASSLGDQVAQAPDRIRQGTEGNPLAAGAVAFGLGVLVGSMAPPTREEVEVAGKVLDPLQEQATAMGQEVAGAAREAATEAMSEVRDQAQEAQQQVTERAQEAQQQVTERAQGAKDQVTGS